MPDGDDVVHGERSGPKGYEFLCPAGIVFKQVQNAKYDVSDDGRLSIYIDSLLFLAHNVQLSNFILVFRAANSVAVSSDHK